jgi:hypothetical protein
MLAQVPGIANARTCGTILALDYVVEGAGYLSSCNRVCWPSSARLGC